MKIFYRTSDPAASASGLSDGRADDIEKLRHRLAELEGSLARLDKGRLPRSMRPPAHTAALALLVVGATFSAVSAIQGEPAQQNALFIDSKGQVGIGTTEPQQSLDVKGTIRSREGGVQFPDGTTQTTAAVPVGAVIAFDLDACPRGWSEYKPAYGRFVRGIDRGDGAKEDPHGQRAAGSLQDDGIRNIRGELRGVAGAGDNAWPWGFRPGTHNAFSVAKGEGGYDGNTYNRYGVGVYNPEGGVGTTAVFDASQDAGAQVRGEVRPKNVALLYCRKDKQ